MILRTRGIAMRWHQEIEAPYGTDICWMYEKGVLTGFYDLVNNEETDIKRILEKKD